MLARHTVPQLDTHSDSCYSCQTLLSDFLCFRPNPNSIQDLDGMTQVVRGQETVAHCLAHEDKHCLAGCPCERPSSHEARRQPHQVEIHQFHAFDVVAGGTRTVEFVLEFFGVGPSPPGLVLLDITCNHCTHDFSPSPMIQWQRTV